MRSATRFQWHERLDSVQVELQVAMTAARHLTDLLQSDPSIGSGDGWKAADARRWVNRLEATYLIRLFAAFEQALRDYWNQGLARKSHPKTEDLIAGIAARRDVPPDICDAVHAVRRYRNQLIHEARGEAPRRQLSSFLSRLPITW
jgi:hypothetical protein